jgi:hypothetical protein
MINLDADLGSVKPASVDTPCLLNEDLTEIQFNIFKRTVNDKKLSHDTLFLSQQN